MRSRFLWARVCAVLALLVALEPAPSAQLLGLGLAIIDSGLTTWHDDVSADGRIDRFVDFVNGRAVPYDDYGHGTHVTGIVAGNGFDSGGARTGIAPGAHVIALKALNGSGAG